MKEVIEQWGSLGFVYKSINFCQPQIGEEEYKYIKKVMDSSYLNEGVFAEKFEKKICELLGCKYTVAVTNGTSALFLSLKALEVGYGDEVIIPDITFIATANAVEMCGAKPVLVDIDKKTMNIDNSLIRKSITSKTKAIIPVHVSGRSADMYEIMDIATENSLFIVEDSAEAFMSKYEKGYLGTFGDTGCFSFSPNKIITTGQGGAVVTNNKEIYMRVKQLKNQGRLKRGTGGDDLHNSIGYNFKFTDLQASVGLGQLHYLNSRIKRLKENYRIYSESIGKKINLFEFKKGELPLWVDATSEKRDELCNYLNSNRVFPRKYWFPLHTQIPYKDSDECFKVSSELSKKAFWLPSSYSLSDKEIDFVCECIKNGAVNNNSNKG